MKRLIKFVPYIIISVIAIGLVFVNSEVEEDIAIESNDATTPLIIIDAGHGGMDGGAVADDGTQEQYLNLDIALKMKEYLSSLGYETLLTRTDDNSIHDSDAESVREQKVSDIHNRLKIIEANPDSVFISVHQNYFTQSKYSGTQVFYSPNNPLSEKLAQSIQTSVVSSLQPDNTRQIKKSDSSIYLLYHSVVPTVLVECGFLSNAEETEKLKREEYRQQMAEAICKGIIKYLSAEEESSSVRND